MSEYSIEDLIAWCDKKVEEGYSLRIKWSGGGGDGDIDFLAGNNYSNEPQAKKLIGLMNDEIGYCWWNGNLLLSGDAKYFPKKQMFKGEYSIIDYEFPEEVNLTCNISLRIPKTILFKEVTISLYEEEISLSFFSDSEELIEEDEVLEKIKQNLEKEIFNEINSQFPGFLRLDYSEVDAIDREQFKDAGIDLVYIIEGLSISIIKYKSKGVSLNLKKILKKSTTKQNKSDGNKPSL